MPVRSPSRLKGGAWSAGKQEVFTHSWKEEVTSEKKRRQVPRQPAWMETQGEWFPVKKDVSTSTP